MPRISTCPIRVREQEELTSWVLASAAGQMDIPPPTDMRKTIRRTYFG